MDPVAKFENRQVVVQDIQKRVEELTFAPVAELSDQAKNEELEQIREVLIEYLTRYQNTSKIVENQTRGLNFDGMDPHSKNKNMYIIYKKMLNADMTQLLQDGYILIENLRKTFTNKEIEYEVGMKYSIGKGRYEVFNKKISLSELLSYAKADIQWRGEGIAAFKLRASATQADFYQDFEKVKYEVDKSLDNLHSLYPKVRSTLLAHNKKNEGNFYETYQHFRKLGWADHSPKRRDPDQLTASEILDKYMEIRKGTQSFVSGGDFGLTQYKLLSGSGASIASLLTIGEALKSLLYYIEQGKSAKVTMKTIKEKVFSKEFDKMIKDGLSELTSEVEELVSNAAEQAVK